jgi:hypothetical protein
MLQQKYRSSLTVQALGLLLRYGIARFGLPGAITVVVVINFILRLMLAARFTRVIGAKLRDLALLKDVGKVALASAVAAISCLFVRSIIMASGARPLAVLVVCFAVFGVLYLGAIFLLGMATTDEREKVRHGVARLQQFVYLGRSANSVS